VLPGMTGPEPQPVLETPRLLLRPLALADAADVQRLAGVWEVADTTLSIPHPYEDGLAEAWIGTLADLYRRREQVVFAITARPSGHLLGTIGLVLRRAYDRAELGYWIGKPFWGRGYATEAAVEVLHYGFASLALHRIHACHFARNPASGRVLQKIGMKQEGTSREHVKRWNRYEDLVQYGILRQEHDAP
jgi:ribosomal-protein-alanine N-acetyltransferase